MYQMQQLPDPPVNQNVPDVVGNRGGLYPRWWILSAFVTSILAIMVLLLGPHFPCSAAGNLCHFTTWNPVVQVLIVWAAFILIWLLALILGVGSIEVPRREVSRPAEFVRSISEFDPLHPLLLIFGAIALCALVAMWVVDSATPFAFAFCSIVVFIANASHFFRHTGRQQRSYLIFYGVLALIALILTLLFRLQSEMESYFLAEALLFGIGVWAIFWHPRPARQLTAQEQREQSNAQARRPLYILRSFWPINRFFPNRPV